MKNYILTFLAISLIAAGCGDRKFPFNPVLSIEKSYQVNQTGNFSEIQTITADDVWEALDLPENSEVEQFEIEKIALRFDVQQNNEATALKTNAKLLIGNSTIGIFDNYNVSIDDAGVWMNLKDLHPEGINALKEKIKGYVLETDYDPFEIAISGDTSPAGQKIHVNIELKISGTITGVYCVETLIFLGEDCDI